jgi:hypothetical protein
MRALVANTDNIACCGLYCGACKKFLRDKCPGCKKNDKAKWCTVRTCCLQHGYHSCADCNEVSDLSECKKLNNFIAWVFGLVFRSDRNACLHCIRQDGYEAFAERMTRDRRMALPR